MVRAFKKCIICGIKEYEDRHVTLHKLPKTPERKEEWIKRSKIDRTKITSSTRICSRHFLKDQVKSMKLIRKALPEDNDKENSSGNKTETPRGGKPAGHSGNSQQFSRRVLFSIDSNEFETPRKGTPVGHLTQVSDRIMHLSGQQNHVMPSPAMIMTSEASQATTSSVFDYKIHQQVPKLQAVPVYVGLSETLQTGNSARHSETDINKSMKIISTLRRRNTRLQHKINKLKSQEETTSCLEACKQNSPMMYDWILSQLKRFKSSHRQYSIIEKTTALTLIYSCGLNGYKTLRKMGFKLPSPRQIRNYLANIDMRPGISTCTSDLLLEYKNTLDDADLDCVMMWDEMSIKEFLQYDKHKDTLEGVEDFGKGRVGKRAATEVLVFMISGIRTTYKIPVSFYFSASNTTSEMLETLVKENLTEMNRLGYRVRMCVCDMSFTNQGLYRKLGIDTTQPFILFPHKIYMVHDTPHLIKLVRNNLMTKPFVLNADKKQVVQWKYIKEFYKQDTNCSSRMAPKLTKVHIFLKDYSKMKVKLASQVLSHSVAAGMICMIMIKKLPVDARATADFVKKIDELFDVLNISKEFDKKTYKSGRFLMDNLDILDEYKTYIEKIYVPKTRHRPDCLHGLALNLTAIKLLLLDLKKEGYRYVATRKLQQDALENLFSFFRQKGGFCRNPTTRQLRYTFKFAFVKSFVKKSENTNCEDHFFENRRLSYNGLKFMLNYKPLSKSSETALLEVGGTEEECTLPSHPPDNSFLKTTYSSAEKVADQMRLTTLYMGSWCVKTVNKSTNCNSCGQLLIESEGTEDSSLVLNKLYDMSVKYGKQTSFTKTITSSCCDVFHFMASEFDVFVEKYMSSNCTKLSAEIEKCFKTYTIVTDWINESEFICCTHRDKMIQLFIRIKLFRLIKDQNEKWVQPKSWDQSRRSLRNQ